MNQAVTEIPESVLKNYFETNFKNLNYDLKFVQYENESSIPTVVFDCDNVVTFIIQYFCSSSEYVLIIKKKEKLNKTYKFLYEADVTEAVKLFLDFNNFNNWVVL